jgi:hypothetical protein
MHSLGKYNLFLYTLLREQRSHIRGVRSVRFKLSVKVRVRLRLCVEGLWGWGGWGVKVEI